MRKLLFRGMIFLLVMILTIPNAITYAYGLDTLYDMAIQIQEKAIGDEVNSVSFERLDPSLKTLLMDQGYQSQDIRAIVEAKLSLVTQAASATIIGANIISAGADTGIGYAKDGLTGAVEALLKSGGQNLASETGQVGKFVVRFYTLTTIKSSYDEIQQLKRAAETAEDVANIAVNAQWLAADFASYILSEEMNYINNNMDMAFRDIWKFNPSSSERLKVYAVHIEKYYPEMAFTERGIRFYYWNIEEKRYVNYFDNVVFTEYEFTTEEKIANEINSLETANALGQSIFNKKWLMAKDKTWFMNLYEGQYQLGHLDDVMRIKNFEIESVDTTQGIIIARVLQEINYDGMKRYTNYPIRWIISNQSLILEEHFTTPGQMNRIKWTSPSELAPPSSNSILDDLYGLWSYGHSAFRLSISPDKLHFYSDTSKGTEMRYDVEIKENGIVHFHINHQKNLEKNVENSADYAYEMQLKENGQGILLRLVGNDKWSEWFKVQ